MRRLLAVISHSRTGQRLMTGRLINGEWYSSIDKNADVTARERMELRKGITTVHGCFAWGRPGVLELSRRSN